MTRYSWVPTSQEGILRLDGQSRKGNLSDINIPEKSNASIHIHTDEMNTPCPTAQTSHQPLDIPRTELLDLSGESIPSSQNPIRRKLFTSEPGNKPIPDHTRHDNIMEDNLGLSRMSIEGDQESIHAQHLQPVTEASDTEADEVTFVHQRLKNHKKSSRKWSDMERRVLYILYRWFDLTWEEVSYLMNKFFDVKNSEDEFTYGKCSAYFNTMLTRPNNCRQFQEIILDKEFGDSNTYHSLKAQLEHAAYCARVRLYPRVEERPSIAHHRCIKKNARRSDARAKSKRHSRSDVLSRPASRHESRTGFLLPKNLADFVYRTLPMEEHASQLTAGARAEFVRPPGVEPPDINVGSERASHLTSRSTSIASPEKETSILLVDNSSEPEKNTSSTQMFTPGQSRANEEVTDLPRSLNELAHANPLTSQQIQARPSNDGNIRSSSTSIASRDSNNATPTNFVCSQDNGKMNGRENDTEIPAMGSSSSIYRPEEAGGQPALVFRFWDSTSGTQYSSTSGFRSGRLSRKDSSFKIRRGPETAFDHPDFLMEADSHFFEFNTPSKFISVTESLLWVVQMAARSFSKGRDAKIAVMNFSQIKEQTSVQHAAPVLRKLKYDSPSIRCRYKGMSEWLVWHRIYPEAILKIVRFADIQGLAADDVGVAQLLRLKHFGTKDSIRRLRGQLQERPLRLNEESGRAIGKIASLFGFRIDSPEPYLEAMAYSVAGVWWQMLTKWLQKKLQTKGLKAGFWCLVGAAICSRASGSRTSSHKSDRRDQPSCEQYSSLSSTAALSKLFEVEQW